MDECGVKIRYALHESGTKFYRIYTVWRDMQCVACITQWGKAVSGWETNYSVGQAKGIYDAALAKMESNNKMSEKSGRGYRNWKEWSIVTTSAEDVLKVMRAHRMPYYEPDLKTALGIIESKGDVFDAVISPFKNPESKPAEPARSSTIEGWGAW